MRLALASAAAALMLAACQSATTETDLALEAEAPPPIPPAETPALAYPQTMTVEQTDTFQSAAAGEVTVADPFRWLEEDVRESEAVAAWVEAQNEVTFAYLDALPGRATIAERLTELFNYERFSLPYREGGRYFFTRNSGLQDQSVLFVQDGLEGEPRELIDPNTWSEDGTVALAGYVPSPDGELIAYFVQDGGSDWRTVKVMDVDTGEEIGDALEWVKFSGLSWAKDGSGIYYSRYPEPAEGEEFTALNLDQAIYFHRIGTDQGEDKLIVADPDNPEVGWNAGVTDDGQYLVINNWRGTDGNGVHILDLTAEGAEPVLIFDGFENNHAYVGNVGSTFLFRTDLDAPNGRVVAVDLADPGTLSDVIPETDAPIQGASHVGGHLIVETLEDVQSVVRAYTPTGDFVRDVDLPGIGSAGGFGGEADDPETFYVFTSFNQPATIYRYDVETGESSLFRAPDILFNPDDYVVDQVFYESTGGARVPMFIVHHRDVTPDGERPVLLYGYGGFGISLTPAFSTSRLTWMEMGGVFALANLRGGAEYGRAWHDSGRLENKQNVFDDFINAAEQLVESGWASPDTIAIQGGSNGGLLVGAVANQRPDLFAAALPAVGVMDMLRFDQFTAGRFWVDDYGSPGDPAMFDVLKAYSPIHNIPSTEAFPATLVTTADTDDRVVPAHSFKYAAALQAAETGSAPTLIRIETRAGHGAGTPISKIIQETADEWAFIAHHTGLKLDADEAAPEDEDAS